jgi:hypothetical protein
VLTVVSSTPLNDTMNGGSNSTMPPARVGVQDLFQRLRYPGGIAGSLTRDSHGVALTDAGRQLLTDAGPLLASAHAARRRVTVAARGSQRLMVGFRAGVAVTPAVQLFEPPRLSPGGAR